MKDLRPKAEAPRCRLCGKSEPEAGKWRKVKAPADTGGRNASVPPPLLLAPNGQPGGGCGGCGS